MRRGTDPAASWEVRQGDDWLLSRLLWVRDAGGLLGRVRPDLPPCAPAVLGIAPLPPERAADAAQAWSTLWAQVVRDEDPRHAAVWPDPEDAASLVGPGPGTGALGAVLAQGWDRQHDWHTAARRRHLAREPSGAHHDPVRPHERRLGRTSRPFRLQVLELPVAGRQGWVVDDHLVLLSDDLAWDEDACAAFLDPVIARLV